MTKGFFIFLTTEAYVDSGLLFAPISFRLGVEVGELPLGVIRRRPDESERHVLFLVFQPAPRAAAEMAGCVVEHKAKNAAAVS